MAGITSRHFTYFAYRMKKFNFLIPHLIAVAVFLLFAVIFCKPALEQGVILNQGDVTGWQGMSNQSYEYKKIHGHVPLWVTSMFSGMPAYQIAIEGSFHPLHYIDRAMQLWLPKPLNFFFLACICFYFLCICLRIKPYAAIAGAVGFAYCSFSPIIITAGHETQMYALAYAPAVIGAVALLLEKKYITGFILTTLFTALQVNMGHQQISYYLFLILIAMFIAYAIRMFRTGDVQHLLKSSGLLVLAGIIGVAVSAITLLTVNDFSKYSKRGGQLVMDAEASKDKVKDGKTVGLTKDYAFMWSYGKAETMSLMFPGVKGYGTHIAERDGEQDIFPKLGENSHVAKFLTEKLNVPEDQAANFALQQSTALYWGDQPFTNGPVYLGAVICFLFLFGMFFLDGKHKWWILAISALSILLAWGDNFKAFNYFMFDYFPLYNKFRVPTMILVIPQLLFPVVAALALSKLTVVRENAWPALRKSLIAVGIVFAAGLIYYASADFAKENTERTNKFNAIIREGGDDMQFKLQQLNAEERPLIDNQLYEGMYANLGNNPDAQRTAREMVSALRKDRAGKMLGDMGRSFLLVAVGAIALFLYIRKKYPDNVLLLGMSLLIAIDLLGFGSNYLNEASFTSEDMYETNAFPITQADKTIMNDPDPHFRVFNPMRGLDESRTSYYHKSIGGYHPAKIGIYDDLIAHQLSGQPNMAVVNMLNTKYIFQQQGDQVVAMRNPGALGNVWFVQGVRFVDGPVEEMKALNNLNTADSAVAEVMYKDMVKDVQPPDSAASIRMTQFDNDAITYQSSSTANHVAVFSEVYYKDWKAYIDGKPAPYFKANYVLRAMVIPAGEHTIEFKFEPTIYFTGDKISQISGWLVFLLTLGWVLWEVLKIVRSNSSQKSN